VGVNLDAVLCYIDGSWAYFTTQNLKDQWGDDWDDAPFDCNAGEPYRWREESDGRGCRCCHPQGYISYCGIGPDGKRAKCGEEGHISSEPRPRWDISKVAFDDCGQLRITGSDSFNNPYSVQDFNTRRVPWLSPYDWSEHRVVIMAGTTLREFIEKVQKAGGIVYLPVERAEFAREA
jgi:hypothetical protein